MISPFLKKRKSSERQSEGSFIEHTVSEDLQQDPLENYSTSGAEEESSSILEKKSHLDKKSLDLVFAVEQMIQAKQRVETSNYEMQDRLNYANGQIDRLNKDLKNMNKVIEDREKSIRDLEQRLAEKNLRVDQMLDDYRELQSTLSYEIEELKSINEVERQKYASLLQKNTDTLAEKNRKINELEEKVGKLEIEHGHMKQKFETLRQEKTHLVNIVNDFAARMTSPFAAKSSENGEVSSD